MLQVSHETAPSPVLNFCRNYKNEKLVCNFLINLFIILLKTGEGEEGEDDARSACPSDTLGYTHNTMAVTARSDEATLS